MTVRRTVRQLSPIHRVGSVALSTTEPVRLTRFASGGGCATKIAQADLASLVAALPPAVADPALLVGALTGDDAAVYRLGDDCALVFTTDFFAPVVDDP